MKGIEAIKSVVGFVFNSIEKIRDIDTDNDGKVEFGEIVGAATGLAVFVPDLIRAIPHLKEEWNDLTNDEVFEVVAFIKEEFDLENDNVEETIEQVIDAVAQIGVVVKEIIK